MARIPDNVEEREAALREEVRRLREAASGVLNSFENYASQNKPESEWDEYDTWIFPLWAKLRSVLASERIAQGAG